MTGLADLTLRELEILQLVLAGKTNRAIAVEIRRSEKTIEFHLNNIYTKIGLRTRMLAGIWAVQQGLDAASGGMSGWAGRGHHSQSRSL